jgi:hypothetical protein
MKAWIAAATVGTLLMFAAAPHLAAQNKTATLWAHAADAAGRPVADLRPTDFQLTVDGKPGRITAVRYAGNPRRILLIVDNTALAPVIPLRAALKALVDETPEDDEMALITIAGQLHIHVEPTTDRDRLRAAVADLNTDSGSPVLMDALVEANDRFLGKEDRMGIIVVVTAEGPESSGVRDEVFNKFVQSFTSKGGVAHALVLSASAVGVQARPTAGGNNPRNNAIINIDTDAESIITMNITKNTGGRYEIVNAATAMQEKLEEFAADIKADRRGMNGWYKIDFAADNPPKTVRLEVTRSDTKIQMTQSRPRLAPTGSR